MGVYVLSPMRLHYSPMDSPTDIRAVQPPPGLTSDPVTLLNLAHREAGASAIVFDYLPAAGQAEFVARLWEGGWHTQVTEGGWFTCKRQAGEIVFVGVRPWVAPEEPMIGPTVGPAHLVAWMLCRWRKATDVHYRHTPGAATVASIRAQPRHKHPKWVLRNANTMDYWEPPTKLVDIHYIGRGGKSHREGHRWDMRSAYLAAMAAAHLPYDKPMPTGGAPFEYGYFRVRLGNPLDRPYWLSRPDRQGTRWMTHEGYQDLIYAPMGEGPRRTDVELIDSITTSDGGRWLRSWAERWRDALLEPRLRAVLKRGYAEAVGLMAVESGGIFRPDVRHIIGQRVAVQIARRAREVKQGTGISPIQINVDSLYYPTTVDVAQVSALIGVGDKIGQMRYEGVQPL